MGVARLIDVDEETLRHMAGDPPPTSDDHSLLTDGRRLDNKDQVLAWLVEIGHLTPAAAAKF